MRPVEDVIQVVGFQERYATDFAELNYRWISEGYVVEEHDREILDHPAEQIINKGGQIFFALAGNVVAGTVALIDLKNGVFELAKMAVAPGFQGRGLSNRLMEACIEFARTAGKKAIVLESNTKQVAAVKLYRKYGFRETELDPNSHFERANIRMELAIDGVSR